MTGASATDHPAATLVTISPALADRLAQSRATDPVKVLVTHTVDADVDDLLPDGAGEVRRFARIHTIACTMTVAAVEQTARRPDVELVDLDDEMHAL